MEDNNDLAQQGQDHADDMWAQGLCLTCGEPNDRKDQNLRTCSKCEAKSAQEPDFDRPGK